MKTYRLSGLAAVFALAAGIGSAIAGTPREGTESGGRGAEEKRQRDTHSRVCKWAYGGFWCDTLKNCREDEDQQMTICDLVVERWPGNSPTF